MPHLGKRMATKKDRAETRAADATAIERYGETAALITEAIAPALEGGFIAGSALETFLALRAMRFPTADAITEWLKATTMFTIAGPAGGPLRIIFLPFTFIAAAVKGAEELSAALNPLNWVRGAKLSENGDWDRLIAGPFVGIVPELSKLHGRKPGGNAPEEQGRYKRSLHADPRYTHHEKVDGTVMTETWRIGFWDCVLIALGVAYLLKNGPAIISGLLQKIPAVIPIA